jgi:uncharacterized protein YeaO (DUF488 family)
MAAVRVRRVYDAPEKADGQRVLVDRLWPRGLNKDAAHLDEWVKQVAPSDELRRWYGHDPERFDEFSARYRKELEDPERAEALSALRRRKREGRLTLLTATRDADRSQAAVLAQLI